MSNELLKKYMEAKDFYEVKEILNERISGMTGSDWAYWGANLVLCLMPVASGRMIVSSGKAIPTIGKLIKASHPFIQTAVITINQNNKEYQGDAERRCYV